MGWIYLKVIPSVIEVSRLLPNGLIMISGMTLIKNINKTCRPALCGRQALPEEYQTNKKTINHE